MSCRIAVVGAGKMGKLHARVISEMPDVELACVVDVDEGRAKTVAKQRSCPWFTNPAEALALADAAIIAVPTMHHVSAARDFIQAGKAVLIEKPLAIDVQAGRELIDLAEKNNTTVQVGHTERFNPAVLAMEKYDIRAKFIESHRISPFTFRSADVGVVMDMMIHDIDLVLMLARSAVKSVHAVGINVIGKHEDVCNARILFENGCVANVTASRLAIKTERKMRIFSEEAYISVDYGQKVGLAVKRSENLDLIQMARQLDVDDLADLAENIEYSKLLNVEQLEIDESIEPLKQQAEAFSKTVTEGRAPVVSAEDGLAAVQTAQMITDSIAEHKWDGDASDRAGLDIISAE
ncbi:MAG TPA: Gfo/Idh/MocA family oxidoreductase [Phycisphaerae bacterium]|nr:Gfo/Idh/MocA family oxidoreductase [Phycisphaerae bacterium]